MTAGFYWVRVPLSIEHPHYAGWTIAKYDPGFHGAACPWQVLGEHHFRALYDLDEIGPRVESPEELKTLWLPTLSPVRHNEQITTVHDRPVVLYSDRDGRRWCVCVDDGPVISLGIRDETGARLEAALIAHRQQPEHLADARLLRRALRTAEDDLRTLRADLQRAREEIEELRATIARHVPWSGDLAEPAP
jgi:hypothetical protein